MNPFELRAEFNTSAGEKNLPPAQPRPAQSATPALPAAPPTPETVLGNGEILYDNTVTAVWARHGLENPVFAEAIAPLSPSAQLQLLRNTEHLLEHDENFASVMREMAENRKKHLGKMMTALATLPAGMTLITTEYERIAPEQNAAVWNEFQEQAEPAFYAYLLAHHREDLQEAGLCAYGIGCLERGVAPTTEDGVPYNIDVDHIIERAGGGTLCTEKSIDPDNPAAPPSFPINHISNLCLIMRGKHESKNTINGLQNLPCEAGAKKRIVMAVSDDAHRRVLLNRGMLNAAEVPTSEAVYFAHGTSLLLTRALHEMKDDFKITPENAQDIYRMVFKERFEHTLKVWENAARMFAAETDGGTLKQSEIKRISESCEGYLKPLVQAFADSGLPADRLAAIRRVSSEMDALLAKAAKDKTSGAMQQGSAHKADNGHKHGHA